MLVYFDKSQHAVAQNMGRFHPWTTTLNTPDGRYFDFKASPEDIRPGLEDLRHVRGAPLEDAIVAFITWANAPEGTFETNDFGLRPLQANESGISSKAFEQMLRLTIFFRDLRRNTLNGDLVAFAQRMEIQLKRVDSSFREACWGWALWPHLFLHLGDEDDSDAEGAVIQYNAWAWGDTLEEVQTNMIRALGNLQTSLTDACGKA